MAFGLSIGGTSPDNEATISIAVLKTTVVSPLVSLSYQSRPVGVDRMAASPPSSCGISPYISA